MAPRKPKVKEFDEAKLQLMTEPISVVINKIIGGRKSPVELPPGQGEAIGGRGYTKDMIRELPSFIANQWSGGGLYEATATSDNGEQMTWEMFFNPTQYPERLPPTAPAPQSTPAPHSNATLAQIGAMYAPPHQPMQHAPGPMFGGYYPNGFGRPAPSYNPFGPSSPFTSPWSPSGGGGHPEFDREREARIKLEAQLERDRQQSQHEKDMAAVTGELRRLQEMASRAPAAAETEALKAAKAQIDELRRQNNDSQMMSMFKQMNDQTLALIKEVQQSATQQIAELRRELASAPKGPDPMMMMLVEGQKAQAAAQLEVARLQADASRESARLQADAAREQARTQLTPAQMIDLFRAGNHGADQMAAAYGRAWDLMAHGVEQILQAQGPGVHPAMAMLENAAQGGLALAERYVQMQEAKSQHQAQSAIVQAQLNAQAQAHRAQQAAAAPAPEVMAPTEEEAEELEAQAEQEAQESNAREQEVAMEKELFGEAYHPILKLRKSIAEQKISPAQTAGAIFQAIQHFHARGNMPQVFGLFEAERFDDFVTAVIPDVPFSFRQQVVDYVVLTIQKMREAQGAPRPQQAPPPQPPPNGV